MAGFGFDQAFSFSSTGFGTGFGHPEHLVGSALFNGIDSFLKIENRSEFFPGTDDFTVEWWQKSLEGIVSNARIFSIGIWNSANFAFSVEDNAYVWLNHKLYDMESYGSVNGSWHHFAAVRKSTVLNVYKDGINISGPGLVSTDDVVADLAKYFAVGNETEDGITSNYSNGFKGYLSCFHLVIGSALYSGNFSRPTAPPIPDSNTKLLLKFLSPGNKLLADSSVLENSVTNVNNVIWSSESPF